MFFVVLSTRDHHCCHENNHFHGHHYPHHRQLHRYQNNSSVCISSTTVQAPVQQENSLTACERANVRLVVITGTEVEDIDIPLGSIQLPREGKLETLDRKQHAPIPITRDAQR